MAEPIYRTCEILAQLLVRATGTRITYLGEEHIPARGGARGAASALHQPASTRRATARAAEKFRICSIS